MATALKAMMHGIGEIAARYRTGVVSPVTYLRELLERIDALDPALHAFISLDRKGAQAAAETATRELAAGKDRGPLHGVPIAIKDVIDVEGLPTTCCSATRLDHLAREDAACVSRLRAAGAVILGKLTTHEFAIGGPSFDLPFPPARNPWDLSRHPGGSSSGAGAGVAAGLFPAALGTDTAGSIRHPASACGIVGLKPTYDLVPRQGVFPLAESMDHIGPLARSVEDAALVLGAIADGGGDYTTDLQRGARGLRIGIVRHFHTVDMMADAQTAASLERVADALAADGAQVREVRLPPLAAFANVNRVILQAAGFAFHARTLRESPERHARLLRKALLPGAFLRAEDVELASRHRAVLASAIEAVFGDVDILLTASSMEPACKIDDDDDIARTYMAQARTPFSLSGHPALAMMSGLSADGLPLSVQFAARWWDERTLLRAAAVWERALGGPRTPEGY